MILNDDKIYGISTMFMDVGLDSGDILESASFFKRRLLGFGNFKIKISAYGGNLTPFNAQKFLFHHKKASRSLQASFCKKSPKPMV